MKILVTGGAGFIGSHTCKYLAQSGYTPVTLDDLSIGVEGAVRWGPFYHGSVHDRDLLKTIITKEQIKAVIHLAGSSYVEESVEQPLKYYENNVVGSFYLLKTLLEHDINQMIFASSCTVYGNTEQKTLNENTPTVPVTPYGQSKLFVEKYIEDLAKIAKFNCLILRYFNVAGADFESDLGENHFPSRRLIPRVYKALNDPSSVLNIYGNDWLTPDGSCVRDYVNVSDIARAHCLAIKRMMNNHIGVEKLNLGSGIGTSVFDIVGKAEELFRKKVSYQVLGRRPGDLPYLVADNTKAQKVLGWSAENSQLDKIIYSAFKWYDKQSFTADKYLQ